MPKNYTYGVIPDEISQDLEYAFQVASELGMTYVEPNNMWEKSAFELDDAEVDKVKALLDQYGLKAHLVCGMFFRPFSLGDVNLDTMEDHPRFQEHMHRLEKYIKLAKAWDAPNIRTFGFTRDVGGTNPSPRSTDGGGITDETLEKIAKGMRIACERLADEGINLALENARSLYANTGGNMRRVLDAVDHPTLKIIWDPANAFVAGEDPAEGYEAVKDHIVDVHCKDATVVDNDTGLTAWAKIGDGGTDWAKQFQILADHPVTNLTIETHWHPKGGDRAEDTRQTFASLKEILAKA
ncbi:MAG: sugar phosphate isomerase/epimerase family protein [Chloroflexota bacterium]